MDPIIKIMIFVIHNRFWSISNNNNETSHNNKIDIRNIGIHIPIILMLVLSIGHTSLFSTLLYWVSTTVFVILIMVLLLIMLNFQT